MVKLAAVSFVAALLAGSVSAVAKLEERTLITSDIIADITGDISLINPGIDIDLDAGVGILAPSNCGGSGSDLLSVGVGISVDLPPLLNIDICVCVNVLQLGPDSNFQACPDCATLMEPICGAGQCGCQCVDNAHVVSGGCACDAGYTDSNGVCVLGASQRARRNRTRQVAAH